jgi:hypothetical protein
MLRTVSCRAASEMEIPSELSGVLYWKEDHKHARKLYEV